MKIILFLLTIVAFICGQIVSLTTYAGQIRISALDISLSFLIAYFLFTSNWKTWFKQYLVIFGPFIFVSGLSLIVAGSKLSLINTVISSLYLFRFIVYSLLTVTIAKNIKIKKISLIGLWFAGIGITLFGLLQYWLYPNLRNLYYLGWDPHEMRLFSTLLDPNFTGLIISLTILASFYLAKIYSNQFIFKLLGWLSLVGLLLTYSRGSWLAFGIGIITLWLIQKQYKKLLILGGLFIIGVYLIPVSDNESINLLRNTSIKARITNTQLGWQIFKSSPIIGIGFNTLRYRTFGTILDEENQLHSAAGFHNSFIYILATTGILGLGSFIWIWRKISINILKLPLKYSSFKQLIFVSILVVFIHSSFDNSLFYPYIMFWLWTLIGSGINLDYT